MPQALTTNGIHEVVSAFAAAARRACQAGFRVLEIHAAHGYLIHEFLSPLSNRREDDYGGSFEKRTPPFHEGVSAVRSTWPQGMPVFLRLSPAHWIHGGWGVGKSDKIPGPLKE